MTPPKGADYEPPLCVKDMEKEQQYLFEDESGDKEFFTIIPNYIANHSNAIDQALYFQLKRLAGDTGKMCYPSNGYLMKQMGVGIKTLRKSFDYLIKNKWIENLGKRKIMTAGGHQWVSAYKINNIWKLNMDYYRGGAERTPLEETVKVVSEDTKGVLKESKGVSIVGAKEERNKELIKEHKTNSDSKESPLKRKDFKVSTITYKEITDAYQQYKGVKLNGAEFGEVKRAIKTMIYSGRTQQNIIDFMKWITKTLEAMKENEQLAKKFCWLENWTILTIKRKMPEFLAGKFQEVEEIEIPSYAKKWQK